MPFCLFKTIWTDQIISSAKQAGQEDRILFTDWLQIVETCVCEMRRAVASRGDLKVQQIVLDLMLSRACANSKLLMLPNQFVLMTNDCSEIKVLYLQSCLVEVFIKDFVFKGFTLVHIHTILVNALLNINMHVFTIFVYILYRGYRHKL